MSGHGDPVPMTARKGPPLRGTAHVPGRQVDLAPLPDPRRACVGETRVTGLLEGQDVLDTARAMRAFGAEVTQHGPGAWTIHGVGVGGFGEPEDVIDCGNSGTGVRLIMGAMATTPITATFTGDASLKGPPDGARDRSAGAVRDEGGGRAGGRLPMTIVGAADPLPVRYTLPVPSAQVKSAVLLAGLNAPGETVVIEAEATRDHTERMLAGFGAEIATEITKEGRVITLSAARSCARRPSPCRAIPSSAAFPVCAALITEGSDVLVPNIGLNPTRAGLYTTLREMGADLTYENEREEGGEPVADLRARFSPDMKGIEVPPERAASMIDEYPILSVVAALPRGGRRCAA
jgi:3-phosphoshikimate 1-carboxyvinyltransferase